MKGSIRFNDAVNAEVTTDGTDITKVVNVATGEEYGGGGGDLSVANVTIVNNSGDIIEGGLSYIYEDPDSPFDGIIVASNTIDTGTYKCPVTAAGNIISAIIDPDNISVEGDAEVTTDNIVGIIVKGDCTITIAAE